MSESSKLVNADGTSVKASQTTKAHLLNNSRPFSSEEDMKKQAEVSYGSTKIDKQIAEDKEKGFDINDPESIKRFAIDYTPLGNTVLVKLIAPEQRLDGIILLEALSGLGSKAIVMVPGIHISSLTRGDVVALGGGNIKYVKRKIAGIEFAELDYGDITGVFRDRETVLARFRKELD